MSTTTNETRRRGICPLGARVHLAVADDLAVRVHPEDQHGTWWRLTKDGLKAAGVAPEDYEKMIEGWFGTTFASLDEAVMALVDAVGPLDKNSNNYVCASSMRGAKAFAGDPNIAYSCFSVIDDKHVKN